MNTLTLSLSTPVPFEITCPRQMGGKRQRTSVHGDISLPGILQEKQLSSPWLLASRPSGKPSRSPNSHFPPTSHSGAHPFPSRVREASRAILCGQDGWGQPTSSSHPLKHVSAGNTVTSRAQLGRLIKRKGRHTSLCLVLADAEAGRGQRGHRSSFMKRAISARLR